MHTVSSTRHLQKHCLHQLPMLSHSQIDAKLNIFENEYNNDRAVLEPQTFCCCFFPVTEQW